MGVQYFNDLSIPPNHFTARKLQIDASGMTVIESWRKVTASGTNDPRSPGTKVSVEEHEIRHSILRFKDVAKIRFVGDFAFVITTAQSKKSDFVRLDFGSKQDAEKCASALMLLSKNPQLIVCQTVN